MVSQKTRTTVAELSGGLRKPGCPLLPLPTPGAQRHPLCMAAVLWRVSPPMLQLPRGNGYGIANSTSCISRPSAIKTPTTKMSW